MKDGQILGFNLHKPQLDVLQEGVGVSRKRQNDAVEYKIDL